MHSSTDKYVGPPYCRSEMYAGTSHAAPWWATVNMLTYIQTNWRTDARPLHYAFY